MFRNKNEQGLTLIELLITISVLAVVSAIALPVINNVVTSSNSNAYNQTLKDAQAFLDKYGNSGVVIYDGLQTLAGYIDKDGDNVIDADEKIDTLTLDSKYGMSATGSAQEGGSYSNGGVTAVTITSSASGNTSGGTVVASESAATVASKMTTSTFYAALPTLWLAGAENGQSSWSTQYPVLLILQNRSNPGQVYQHAYISTAAASSIAQSWTANWAAWNFPAAPLYGGTGSPQYAFHLDNANSSAYPGVVDAWASYILMKLDGQLESGSTNILQTTF